MATQLNGATRNRAILIVRAVTLGGAVGALGLTWIFSNLAQAYFSGKTPTARAPEVPASAAPAQRPPTVVTTVVHHPAGSGPAAPAGPAAPRPPAQGPAPPPKPPPPPVCHSTPSKPC